jgi:hypothetical protein
MPLSSTTTAVEPGVEVDPRAPTRRNHGLDDPTRRNPGFDDPTRRNPGLDGGRCSGGLAGRVEDRERGRSSRIVWGNCEAS